MDYVQYETGFFIPFKAVHLLGITMGNEQYYRQVETALTLAGYIVFAPVIYDYDVYLQHKDMLKDMCYAKLQCADICVVVTPWHIGKSTTERINQAINMGIPVYMWDYTDNRMGRLISTHEELESYKEKLNQ